MLPMTTSDNNGHNNNLHQTVISSVDQPPLLQLQTKVLGDYAKFTITEKAP